MGRRGAGGVRKVCGAPRSPFVPLRPPSHEDQAPTGVRPSSSTHPRLSHGAGERHVQKAHSEDTHAEGFKSLFF